MWNRDIANSSPDIHAANGVLEGSPLTLTLSLIHTLNFVVSQTACLRLWPEKTTHVCLIMRLPYSDPVGSAHTQCCTCEVPDLFVTSNRSIGIASHCCCSSEQRRYAGSYCLLQLSCTSTVTLYVHLINVTTLCSSHLVQWGTLTVIHLSHACGIPSLTSSLTVPHPALFCHTSTAPYVMHYNFMLNTQVQSAELRKLHNTVTMARHCCPGRDDTLRHILAGLSVRYKCITFLLNTQK